MDGAVRKFVRERALDRCEYCRLPQSIGALIRFHVEHICPRQHGGGESPENLALACPNCNWHKGPNLAAVDPATNQVHYCSTRGLISGKSILSGRACSSSGELRKVGRRRACCDSMRPNAWKCGGRSSCWMSRGSANRLCPASCLNGIASIEFAGGGNPSPTPIPSRDGQGDEPRQKCFAHALLDHLRSHPSACARIAAAGQLQ